MEIIVIILVIFIIGLAISTRNPRNYVNREEDSDKDTSVAVPNFHYQYRKKSRIMSAPEAELFQTLNNLFGDKYFIFPQVHLPNLFGHFIYGQSWRGAYSHIDRKSVDFVICDKNNITPLLGIELDDSSHFRPDRHQRDIEVESIFKQANLPLLRLENHGSFNPEEIKTQIAKYLDTD